MDYEEKLIASAVSLVFGLFIFGIIFLPVSFIFSHRANKQRPEKTLPVVLMAIAGTLFVLHILFLFGIAL